VVNVKGNSELLKSLFVQPVVFVDNLLRGDALFFGPNGDGSAVLVGTTHPNYVFAKQAKVADINISGKVGAREVAKV
jgi:hypothetical protein